MQQALWRLFLVLFLSTLSPIAGASDESREALEFFEREIRPVLVEHCQKCHGAQKQESDLRLDSREAIVKGGVSGSAIQEGKPEESLLVAAIRHEGDTKMPPNKKLTDAQIAAVTRWVQLGAPWPNDGKPVTQTGDRARNHWAFQPVVDPPVPTVAGNTSSNPVDAFIAAKLKAADLIFSPQADRRTLIRRASYSLTGLPPTSEEVESFVRDDNPRAYEQLIERLLASPHYGEHWGRRWLDIARYSDTKGYVYAREQRMWVHAWVYRDWVVKALNDDMPYNRFLLLQIAADQAAPEDKSSLAAMGFLTLGRRFLGVARDVIDDRIDVVTRGTMGLTVGCARCHDHKYDPIPTRDYYSLYGVFQSSSERLVPVQDPTTRDEAYQAFETELQNRQKKLAETMAARRAETSSRVRSRAGEYLAAQFELSNYPEEGFDQILEKTDILPTFVRRWQAYLAQTQKTNDPVFVAWHRFVSVPADGFSEKVKDVVEAIQSLPDSNINLLIKQKFTTAPANHAEVAHRYGEVFADVDRQWQAALKEATDQKRATPTNLPDPAAEGLRQVLYSPTGPCEVPDEPIVNIEYFFDSNSCNELWRLQNEIDNWILQSPKAPQHAAILIDREPPTTPRVFKRGNPATKGEEVPRHFVSVIAGAEPPPFKHGSGRLELAQAIIDPKNPLTARVLVNRVWANHFGAGLVRTPSDFGTRAEPPSHPELLDWLTSRFLEDGWSVKKLHRRIMLSQAYQQSSAGPKDSGLLTKAQQNDPENRLLWRTNERRLSFEEMCDSFQAASGSLDRTLGGKAADLLGTTFRRRAVYGFIDRQFLPSTFRIFDFANPDLHIPQRSDTTVPQQALFFLNHPLLLRQAQALAARTTAAPSDADRVQQMYRFAYQRAATPEQLQLALDLVRQAKEDKGSVVPPSVAAWQYGFGTYDEANKQVINFGRLPHFTGSAWQGGTNYPDAKLGWVQLSALGGHPGNDLQHAAVRRWVAPLDMRVKVQSELVHEPKEGKGVRGFLVSSRAGLLKMAHVHNNKAELGIDLLEVKAGDTIDFVADIGTTLSHNQFLWKVTITSSDAQTVWDSQSDFQNQAAERLEPWEQLAQVLLSANEFVFID